MTGARDMSVLSQARSTLSTIAKGFRDRAAVAATAYTESATAVGRVNAAEEKTKSIRNQMSRLEKDAKAAVASLQAVISQTQTADRHNAVASARAAETKAKAAADAMASLEEKYKDLREAVVYAQGRVNEAKAAQANAASAISKTASSL